MEVNSVSVRTQSGQSNSIKYQGMAHIFGKSYYCSTQFINIVCAYDAERNPSIHVTTVYSQTGQKVGYDLFIREYSVTLKPRYKGKLMIGSLKPLLDAIHSTSCDSDAGEEVECDDYIALAMRRRKVPASKKAKENLKSLAKTERAVNRVRRVQHRLGFQSEEHAAISLKRGFFINVHKDVSHKDFQYASEIYGPDIAMAKGKFKYDRKIEAPDFVPELADGELVVEVDVGFNGPYAYLNFITLPMNYGISIYLGRKGKGKYRTAQHIYVAVVQAYNKILSYGYKIKYLMYDSERSLDDHSKNSPLEFGSFSETMLNKYGVKCVQLPPGVHAKHVERRNRSWKEKMRACNFKLLYAVPDSIAWHLGVAAMNWCNMDPTEANINMTPPLVLMLGESIDYSKLCVASFGEIVLVPVDNGVQQNSVIHSRAKECVYLYPKSAVTNMHEVIPLDSIDKQRVEVVKVVVRQKHVLPFTPLAIVARINAQAVAEVAAMSKKKSLSDSELGELEDATGYSSDLILDTPPDLLLRDRRTVAAQPLSSSSVPNSYVTRSSGGTDSISFEYSLYTDASFLVEKEGERGIVDTFLSAYTSFADDDDYDHYSFAVKKEVNYHKARKVFKPGVADQSMRDEFSGLVKKWHPVHRKSLTPAQIEEILRGHGLVKEKLDTHKGRFVADGSVQKYSEYDIYREVSAPTAMLSSLFGVVSYAAAKGKAVAQFDVKQAFTQTPMKPDQKPIFVRIDSSMVRIIRDISPELHTLYGEYMESDGSVIVQLDYALYGTIEAGRMWYDYFKSIVLGLNYVVCPMDDCTFNRFDDNGFIIATIVLHVDDGFITADTEGILDELFSSLEAILGKLSIQRGKVINHLGMQLDFRQKGKCYVTIEKMITSILDEWKVKDKVRSTPARPDLFDEDEEPELLDKEESKKLHRGIAQLLYFTSKVRPDALLPVIYLTSRVRSLSERDLSIFMDVLYYLNGTVKLGLVLGAGKDGKVQLYAYADSSFAVYPDAKGQGGTVISYGRGSILSRSCKLPVAASTAETELYQLSNTVSSASRELEFAKYQQYIPESEPGVLLEDNMSAIHMANKGKSVSHRTRHIKVKYFFVKEFLDNGEFTLIHCPTKEMIADILTKPLQGELFRELRDFILGYTALSY